MAVMGWKRERRGYEHFMLAVGALLFYRFAVMPLIGWVKQ